MPPITSPPAPSVRRVQRVFYIQAREKAHARHPQEREGARCRALAHYLSGPSREADRPSASRAPRDLSLLEPIDAAWIVGSIGVGYDEASDRILVVANEASGRRAGDAGRGGHRPAFAITRAQAAAFVAHARTSCSRPGRQHLPVCSQPKDATGTSARGQRPRLTASDGRDRAARPPRARRPDLERAAAG